MFCFRLHWFQDHSPALLGEAHDFLWLAPFGTEQATNLSQKMSICWRLSQQAPHSRGGRSHGSLETYLCMLEKKSLSKTSVTPPAPHPQMAGSVVSFLSAPGEVKKQDEGSLAFTNEEAQKLLISRRRIIKSTPGDILLHLENVQFHPSYKKGEKGSILIFIKVDRLI